MFLFILNILFKQTNVIIMLLKKTIFSLLYGKYNTMLYDQIL